LEKISKGESDFFQNPVFVHIEKNEFLIFQVIRFGFNTQNLIIFWCWQSYWWTFVVFHFLSLLCSIFQLNV